MMHSRIAVVPYLVVLALASGCPKGTPLAGPPINCPDWGCGSNAASMGANLSFHELDASRKQANSAGLKYVSFADANAVPLTLEVHGHRIVGVDPAGTSHTGIQLEGAILVLDNNGRPYYVRITKVGEIKFWVAPQLEPVPTYTFEYGLNGGREQFVPLCKGQFQPTAEWSGIATQLALVFTGDRYDARAKTVFATGASAGKWFNIACAGTAVAKMHLLRHTEAGSQGGPFATTPDERQAMLKMLTDDICGAGRSFTRDGEEVYYMDAKRWHPFDLTIARSIEAIWDKDGAMCLDEPRREAEEPGLVNIVATECKAQGHALQSCATMVTKWDQVGYGISANP